MRLADLRKGNDAWRIAVLNGPALTRVLTGDLEGRLAGWA